MGKTIERMMAGKHPAGKHQAKGTKDKSLEAAIDAFLTDLSQANRSVHTCHAYANDLAQFRTFCREQRERCYPAGEDLLTEITEITVDMLRVFFNTFDHLSPATRARKQAHLPVSSLGPIGTI